MNTTDKVYFGDFSDAALWTDKALEHLIACERRWRSPGTEEVIACAERELQRRKKEAHGKEDV